MQDLRLLAECGLPMPARGRLPRCPICTVALHHYPVNPSRQILLRSGGSATAQLDRIRDGEHALIHSAIALPLAAILKLIETMYQEICYHLEKLALGVAVVVLHAKETVDRALGGTTAGKWVPRVDSIQRIWI